MSAFYNEERLNNTNFLSSNDYSNGYGSYNSYGSYGNGRGIEAGFKSSINFISNHKFGTIGFLCIIPILTFIIVGFISNQYILGYISISFLLKFSIWISSLNIVFHCFFSMTISAKCLQILYVIITTVFKCNNMVYFICSV